MPHRDMDQELVSAARAGRAGKVSELLACGANPRKKKSNALRWAALYGHVECVRLLLPTSDPMAEDSYALRGASQNGHAECAKMLLTVSDAKAKDCHAIQLAARNAHADCVRMLLPVSSPLCEIGGFLEEVFESGHENVAALLIEEEPKLLDGVDLSECLAAARKRGHHDLAAYVSSIMDQKALVDVAPDASACGGRRHARL